MDVQNKRTEDASMEQEGRNMSECVVRTEMPQKCFNCDFWYECKAFYAPEQPKPFMKGCRMVCQLPEGHGRLVDAEAAFAEIVKRSIKGYISNTGVYAALQEAPTIVPADTAERSEK